jgi:hypothetical protein
MGLADCRECGQPIDGDLPAIGLWTDQGGDDQASYVPFVEDLRTSGFRLVHLECYAKRYGVDSLINVVHERDRRTRQEMWDLIHQVDELKTDRDPGRP